MSTRRTVIAGAATAALLTPCAALAAAPDTPAAHHPRAWSPTQTLAVHVHGTALGAVPAAQRLRISVGLPLRHRAAMNRLAVAMSTPGNRHFEHFLDRTQVRHRFGPRAATVRSVTHWLRDAGFSGVRAAPNRLLVDATATAGVVTRTFNTSLQRYRVGSHVVFANTRPAMVPTAMAGKVTAVLGLSNLRMHAMARRTLHPQRTAAGTPNLTGFTPRQVSAIYDASSLPAAQKTSVAVIGMGDMQPIIKNLRYAERQWHYAKVPVTVVYGGPKYQIVHDNPLTGNAEWDLDTQISTMEAKAVKRLYIYDEQTFTDEDVARGINQFVAQDKALTGSASLGECDYIAWADGAMLTTDQALEEGALQGQSFFASTGDNGSFCPEVASTGVPGGPPDTSWPATGTWTTAVGGTTVLADDKGKVSEEAAWIGGGGGVSPFETGGNWTIRASGTPQTAEFTNQGGRAVPDIAAIADENTPVLIYTGGTTPSGIGGTSVSAPLVSGLWARIQNVHHGRLGVASTRFYGQYNRVNPGTVVSGPTGPVFVPEASPKPVPGFRDVTLGGNGLFTARPGYDETTGIGTLLCAKLSAILK